MMKTNAQKIAETEARLARLKAKEKSLVTRKKVIAGSILLAAAEKDPKFAHACGVALKAGLTRDVDRVVMESVLADLRKASGLQERD